MLTYAEHDAAYTISFFVNVYKYYPLLNSNHKKRFRNNVTFGCCWKQYLISNGCIKCVF